MLVGYSGFFCFPLFTQFGNNPFFGTSENCRVFKHVDEESEERHRGKDARKIHAKAPIYDDCLMQAVSKVFSLDREAFPSLNGLPNETLHSVSISNEAKNNE